MAVRLASSARLASLSRSRALLRLGPEEHETREILRIDHANDVFRTTRLVVHRHARVHVLDDLRAGLLDRHVRRQREDALARSHDLAHRNVVEFNGAVNQRLLKTRQNSPRRRAAVVISFSSSGE